MGAVGLVLGSAGAAACAMLFFMLTAFGGGGLVAPGRTPPSRAVERYLSFCLVAGPLTCLLLGALPWLPRVSAWCFAGPPALGAALFAVILRLCGRR